jgi:DNA-binding HxlR family transcriptional regulator
MKRDTYGISHKMLSQTLQKLEQQHFVIRTVYPTVPPRVEYQLTTLAQTLLPMLIALIEWAQTHASELPIPEHASEQMLMFVLHYFDSIYYFSVFIMST